MNFKETIISSFFFHLFLFLLMIAISSYTSGLSGGIRNVISVDLAAEESNDPAAAAPDSGEEAPMSPVPPSEETMRLPEQAEDNPPAEPAQIPEEKKADTAKIENTENSPSQPAGFTSMEAYQQFIMVHKKIFGKEAGARVNMLLGEALNVNQREFYGDTGFVTLQFGADGKLSQTIVDSPSPNFKAFLEEINWAPVPAPVRYSLRSTWVQIEFAVREGYISFKVNAL